MRKESIRLEDAQDAEREIMRVIYGRGVTEEDRQRAALLMLTLDDKRIEQLSRLVPEYKTNNPELVHPSIIRKTRTNCAPTKPAAIHKRNVQKLWCPKGYLPPKLIQG